MVTVAVIADSHFDASSRWQECLRIHDWMAQDIDARGVDLVLHAGDVYERRSTPEERMAVSAWLGLVAERRPVVVVRGNHDAPQDLALLGRLDTRHPVVVVETAEVAQLAGVSVACLAWPRKAHLLARVAPGQADGAAGDALRQVLGGLGAELQACAGPRLLLAHAMVRGSMTSTGQPLVGCDLEVGLEDLALCRADAYLLGHIHMGQDWDIAGSPCIYPGSPRRTAFGEREPKGYLLLRFEGAELGGWERIETPCRPMLHVEMQYRAWEVAAGLEPCAGEDEEQLHCLAGAEVRLRYTVAAYERAAAKASAESMRRGMLQAGAVSVQVEEAVVATSSARAPEVAAARSTGEKLRAYWRARGDEPEARRAERLLALAQELEEEARHAA